jgi:tRNA pseudouridine55 synthase
MTRRRKGEAINGWINLDKPEGITSTKAVAIIRRILNAQKAGHAGTLDPLASGILPIALGEATKTISFMQDALKSYRFTVRWGEARSTDDAEGEIIQTSSSRPDEASIKAALPRFTGDIMQKPPAFSAIKLGGERAYDLARAGEDIDIAARPVYIETMALTALTQDEATFEALCGKGTYIRSLARDMAKFLGTCGYISALRRLSVGGFHEKDAISLDFLENLGDSAALKDVLLPLERSLDDIPALPLTPDEGTKLRHGQSLSFISRPDFARLEQAGLAGDQAGGIALALCQNRALALVEVQGASIKPVRLFNL